MIQDDLDKENINEQQNPTFWGGAVSGSLFHGTTYETHLAIQKSKYIGWDYGWCKGIHLTDDFNKAFMHGLYIYEFNLPFQNDLISMIPNTDTEERELWLDFCIPIHRVKKVWIPMVDYDTLIMSKVMGFF